MTVTAWQPAKQKFDERTKLKRSKAQRRFLEVLEPRHLLSAVPVLHSFPESENKLFLDFDGEEVTGTTWNVGGDDTPTFDTIHAPPFDIDGQAYDSHDQPVFSEEEIARIVSIWERMAEDFLPFNVDVTTEDPSLAEPDIFETSGRAQRIIFSSKFDAGLGGTGGRWFHRSNNGSAALDSWNSPLDLPAWVFSTHAFAGEIGSHEAGHALGLEHDGNFLDSGELNVYRGPHGSGDTAWSPIMGQGNRLTQWSNGEYPSADNDEDDIGIMAGILGRRPDDYSAIQPLVTTRQSRVDLEGAITWEGDKDIFSFVIDQPGTHVQLDVMPWHNGPNLDVGVTLQRFPATPIIRARDSIANPTDRLSSHIDVVLEPGTYYLTIDGVGKEATPDDPGYSDYGSLGYYHITGAIGDADSVPGDLDGDGALSASDIDALYAAIRGGSSSDVVEFDLSSDGNVDQDDADVLVHQIFVTEYGDFDLDGDVDFTDFLVLPANFGADNKGWADGDATGDGQVNFADFLLLSANFGWDADQE